MFNKSILMGRLTRDPDMRSTQSGVEVVSFTLAANRRFKNAAGEYESDFINCVAWRKTAEFIKKYFNKGDKLLVVGSLQSRTYDDKDGKRVYVTEIVADEAYFVDSKSERGSAPAQGGDSFKSGGGKSKTSGDDDFLSIDTDDAPLPFDL